MTEEIKAFTKDELESFLKGGMINNYFDLNKKGYIIPSSFKSSVLSKDIQKAFPITTMEDNNDIYVYDKGKGIYEFYGKQKLRAINKKILGDYYTEKNSQAVINDITASTMKNRQDLVPPLHLIATNNGLLNILSNNLILAQHTPAFFFTNKLPVKYKPNAKPKKFLKFLNQIQPDAVAQMQIQEMFGYCLWRQYPYQVAFLLIGAGANGRSTLLGVLQAMLGQKNVSAESLQSICHDRFSKAELLHKYANICGDIPSKPIEDTSAFKQLNDGLSLISAQRKHRDPFNFINYAKLIFLANKTPPSYDDSIAYYRRWVLIFFAVRFGIQPGDIPADKHIIDKLTTPEELSGVLNWSLEGLRRLRKNGEFTKIMTVEQTREYYERLVSPLSAYIQDKIRITYNEKDFILKEEWQNKLEEYCEEKKIVAPTKASVGRLMKKVAPKIKTGQRKVGEDYVYVWTGCTFKLTEEEKESREKKVIDDIFREASKRKKIDERNTMVKS